jgi:hypothetical protein
LQFGDEGSALVPFFFVFGTKCKPGFSLVLISMTLAGTALE